jgi:hypothetical protein
MQPRASRSLLALAPLLDALPSQATLTDEQRAMFAAIDDSAPNTSVEITLILRVR